MTDEKRACVAIAAASIINKHNYSYVYDYSNSQYRPFSVQVDGYGHINIYDYSRHGYFSGIIPSLFDYITSSYITMNVNGVNANGFDYQSGTYYDCTVKGKQVNLYDYEKRQFFYYTVS